MRHRLLSLCCLAIIFCTNLWPRELMDSPLSSKDGIFACSLTSLPADTLLGKSDFYRFQQPDLEKALLCLTTLSDRYTSKMAPGEKEKVIEALSRQYEILAINLSDPVRGYECLKTASQIMAETGTQHAGVYFNLGLWYQTAFSANPDDISVVEQSLVNYRMAFDTALHQGDGDRLNNVLPNLINVHGSLHPMTDMAPLMEQYRRTPNRDTVFKQFNLLLYQAYDAIDRDDQTLARQIYGQQLQVVPRVKRLGRLRALALLQLSRLDTQQGRYDEANSCLDSLMNLACDYGMTTEQRTVWNARADLYRARGDKAKAEACELQALRMADSLARQRSATALQSVQVLESLANTGIELREASKRRDQYLLGLLLIGLTAIAVSIMAGLLRRKNTRLRQAHAALYDKMQLILKKNDTVPETTKIPVAIVPQQPMPENVEDMDAPSDWQRVRELEANQAIFAAGFSLHEAADLLGITPKRISAAVSQNYGAGFPIYIGDLRVREACRRIDDVEKYGHLTLDVIAAEVGIKSRTTFVTAFRRVTGLSPSEYLREARCRTGRQMASAD